MTPTLIKSVTCDKKQWATSCQCIWVLPLDLDLALPLRNSKDRWPCWTKDRPVRGLLCTYLAHDNPIQIQAANYNLPSRKTLFKYFNIRCFILASLSGIVHLMNSDNIHISPRYSERGAPSAIGGNDFGSWEENLMPALSGRGLPFEWHLTEWCNTTLCSCKHWPNVLPSGANLHC